LILADTDVLIDYLAGMPPVAKQVLEFVQADRLHTSAVTCFELLTGAREGRRGDSVRSLIANLPVLPIDREVAARAATVRQQLARNGVSIGMADSLIAGVALVSGMPLLTRNRKHFDRVEGLNLIPVAI
jgi:predicted nucleic acid-binding protein